MGSLAAAVMTLGSLPAGGRYAAYGGGDGPVGRAPAEDESGRLAGRVVDGDVGDGDAVDLGLAGADHVVVVGRGVGDVAGAVLLLDAADAVLQARRTRQRP